MWVVSCSGRADRLSGGCQLSGLRVRWLLITGRRSNVLIYCTTELFIGNNARDIFYKLASLEN